MYLWLGSIMYFLVVYLFIFSFILHYKSQSCLQYVFGHVIYLLIFLNCVCFPATDTVHHPQAEMQTCTDIPAHVILTIGPVTSGISVMTFISIAPMKIPKNLNLTQDHLLNTVADKRTGNPTVLHIVHLLRHMRVCIPLLGLKNATPVATAEMLMIVIADVSIGSLDLGHSLICQFHQQSCHHQYVRHTDEKAPNDQLHILQGVPSLYHLGLVL